MSNISLMVLLLVVMAIAYQAGMVRSRKVGQAASVRMHSRSHHYGMYVGLWAVVPAFLVFVFWQWFSPTLVEQMVLSEIQPYLTPDVQINAVLRRISNLASEFSSSADAEAWEVQAAAYLKNLQQLSNTLMVALMAALAALGIAYSYRSISPLQRARNKIEQFVQVVLALSSAVAILTTFGIVMSMVGETLNFFSFIRPVDFFFGTTWNPRFSTTGSTDQGSFGLLPLLGGTMMIAGIALLVAIPLGLLAAIYLAEYASPRLRNIAKPIIEVLAGIPTIVYGFFALVTVGPFLSEFGELLGLDIRATSALTAGVVMGIMIIPFISSLSDDIITQVPKSLRDGSLGLGSTKSETIRKVVLPAALPGIVGAILLAGSRAIGETMIVVLAAGNSPVLTANPFDAVSTVTVTIVNQLTGDNDFSSPQSLVAFALGLTLFVITLLLNVVALMIVRKYREQYE